MSNTIFSKSTMETSYGCIYIQSPYSIDFTNTPGIQSILGFDSSVLEKEIDDPSRYYMNLNWNQIDVSNGSISDVISIPTGYDTSIHWSSCFRAQQSTHIDIIDNDEYVIAIHNLKTSTLFDQVITR